MKCNSEQVSVSMTTIVDSITDACSNIQVRKLTDVATLSGAPDHQGYSWQTTQPSCTSSAWLSVHSSTQTILPEKTPTNISGPSQPLDKDSKLTTIWL